MKIHISLGIIIGVLAVSIAPAWATITSSKKLSDGAQYAVDGGTLRVQFWSPEIVRITYAASNALPELNSLSVVAKPETVSLTRQENDQAFTLATSGLKVKIDKQTGAVSFLDADGHVIFQEAAQGRSITPARVAGASVTSCGQSFELAADEGIYGLGQHQRGAWNYASGGNVQARAGQHGCGNPGRSPPAKVI